MEWEESLCSPPGLAAPTEGASREKRVPGPRQPLDPGSPKPSGCPEPLSTLTFRAQRAVCSNAGDRRFSRPARTRNFPTVGRAQTTSRGPEPLACSLARTRARVDHATRRVRPHTARGPQRYALAWARFLDPRHHAAVQAPWYQVCIYT